VATVRDRLRAIFERIRTVLTPGESLIEQSVTGGIWLTLLNVTGRAFQILTVVFLARLLDPRAFGIVGSAMLVITGLRRVSKLGLNDALIYNENENVDPYLNTVWVLNGSRGIVLGGLLFAAAPGIAWFFSEPNIEPILRAMAIGPAILGLRNPSIVYFKKDLNFHKQFVYDVSGDAAYFLTALAYAVFDPTVWALAFGYVARNVVRTGFSFLLSGYRPWPSIDVARAAEMIDYGKWITASNVLNYVSNQGDDIFVSWLLGSSALGFYQLAYRLSNAPATELAHVVSQVSFPAYSKVQDDPETVRSAFYRTIRLSMFLVAPMAIGIALVTEPFVTGVLGEQWVPMIVPMQLLAIYGLLRGYLASFGSVWRATGNQDYLVKVQLLTIVLIAVPIYPAASRYGISGVAMVIVAVYAFVMTPVDMYFAVEAVDGSFRRLAKEFAYPLPAAGTMGLVGLWVQRVVTIAPLFEFVLLVVVGIVTYAAAVLALESRIEWGIVDEIRELASFI